MALSIHKHGSCRQITSLYVHSVSHFTYRCAKPIAGQNKCTSTSTASFKASTAHRSPESAPHSPLNEATPPKNDTTSLGQGPTTDGNNTPLSALRTHKFIPPAIAVDSKGSHQSPTITNSSHGYTLHSVPSFKASTIHCSRSSVSAPIEASLPKHKTTSSPQQSITSKVSKQQSGVDASLGVSAAPDKLYNGLLPLVEPPKLVYHQTKYCGQRTRKYPHYVVTAKLHNDKTILKEFVCPRNSTDYSHTAARANEFLRGYGCAIWLLCEHYSTKINFDSVPSAKCVQRKNKENPILVLSYKLNGKVGTKSFSFTRTNEGQDKLVLQVHNYLSTFTMSTVQSKPKWVFQGQLSTGTDTTKFVEKLPFDVQVHRVHDLSVVVRRTINLLAVAVCNSEAWGSTNRLDDTYECKDESLHGKQIVICYINCAGKAGDCKRICGSPVCTCELPKTMCVCGMQRERKCECGFEADETSIHFKCGWRLKLVIRMPHLNKYEVYHSYRNTECHDSPGEHVQRCRRLSTIQRDLCDTSRVLHNASAAQICNSKLAVYT